MDPPLRHGVGGESQSTGGPTPPGSEIMSLNDLFKIRSQTEATEPDRWFLTVSLLYQRVCKWIVWD